MARLTDSLLAWLDRHRPLRWTFRTPAQVAVAAVEALSSPTFFDIEAARIVGGQWLAEPGEVSQNELSKAVREVFLSGIGSKDDVEDVLRAMAGLRGDWPTPAPFLLVRRVPSSSTKPRAKVMTAYRLAPGAVALSRALEREAPRHDLAPSDETLAQEEGWWRREEGRVGWHWEAPPPAPRTNSWHEGQSEAMFDFRPGAFRGHFGDPDELRVIRNPCIDCGELTESHTRCDECWRKHRAEHRSDAYERERKYDRRHRARSTRLRRLQPFCTDCGHPGSPDNPLAADHLESAADKLEQGLPLTDADYAVRCRDCNSRKGKAKGRTEREARKTDQWVSKILGD